MRPKEDAPHYRSFPDPNLPPLVVDDAWIDRIRASLPELPDAMRARFASQYGINMYEAVALTASRETARYFQDSVAAGAAPKLAATWMMGEVSAALNRDEIDIAASRVSPQQLASLLKRVHDGTISGKIAK